jgi:hypothetical protein
LSKINLDSGGAAGIVNEGRGGVKKKVRVLLIKRKCKFWLKVCVDGLSVYPMLDVVLVYSNDLL